ncbi:MAG: sulfatase-like hydrolase/transferase [Proteobacteria bacterium]|nr:sulfatase-like hydrolase/transferase [Pseudomonadota bacterium]
MNKNVVFIMLDTLQFNYLGCYGNHWIKTPNIDMFAQEATLFENAYTEGLPTIPCRRAMMTGRYTLPAKGWGPLDPDERPWPTCCAEKESIPVWFSTPHPCECPNTDTSGDSTM